MAGKNIPLSLPPLNRPIQTQSWLDWFRDVHYKISNKNHQYVTGATSLNLDANYISLNSTGGGYAVTLDPPTIPGVYKVIEMTVDGGDVTLALTNVVGGTASTTCTWNDVRDTLIVVSTSDKWRVVTEGGVTLT